MHFFSVLRAWKNQQLKLKKDWTDVHKSCCKDWTVVSFGKAKEKMLNWKHFTLQSAHKCYGRGNAHFVSPCSLFAVSQMTWCCQRFVYSFWSSYILSQHWPQQQNRENRCVCAEVCLCVRIRTEWRDITVLLSGAVCNRLVRDEWGDRV